MKIQIEGNVLQGGFVKPQTNPNLYSLYINTKERWVSDNSYMRGKNELVFFFDEINPDSREITEGCVKFIAENDYEKQVIQYRMFIEHCKDQIYILLVNWEEFGL